MRRAIALGTVRGASCRAQPVRAPSTVQRCLSLPSPRSRGCRVVFVVRDITIFATPRESSKDRIKYVLSQQCRAQAWTLRAQDAGEKGTSTHKARTVGAHAHTEHTISAGLWHDLHPAFDRDFFCFFSCVTSSTDRFLLWGGNDQWQRLVHLWSIQRLARLMWLLLSFVRIRNI